MGDNKEKYYDVDATLVWGPLIFGMMLGGAMSRGRGGPVMMRPGMGPVMKRTVPGVGGPSMLGPGMGPIPRGAGMGGPFTGMYTPGTRPRHPMF